MRTSLDAAARQQLPPTLARVRRRLAVAHLLEGCAGGAAIVAVAGGTLRVAGWSPAASALASAAIAGIAALLGFVLRRPRRSVQVAADHIERARPECRNVVITAVELCVHPERARAWIRERVLSDAERMLGDVDPRSIVPLRVQAGACVLATFLAAAVVITIPERAAHVLSSTITESGGAAANRQLTIVATLEPPAHTKLRLATLSQPDRITAVQGTRVRLTIGGMGDSGRVRFGSAPLETRAAGDSAFAEITLVESGYLSIDHTGDPKLIPVVVVPDRVPAIKIERPGRDLLVPDAKPTVSVVASATDDFGLELLALRYTKVSGSGEQYEFVEGELPLAVSRHDSRAWQGSGNLPLGRLGLEPGDSLVYRVVARDGRPGEAGFASSDTFFVEVAGPGQVALEGFEMPPDRERYALSQQMIVLKIQRLRERERALAADVVREQAGAIAAEQRGVRANFVFLMGGHVEDEEQEAEHSHEIQEGRLENTARQEISRAVGYMSHAEQALVAVDTAAALKQARLAVDALQRAFGRNRYILRTLPVRSRIDPSRRLTGKLDDARDSTRKLPPPLQDARAEAIRDLLSGMIRITSRLKGPEELSAADAATLAERALAIDPAAAEWQKISATLAARRLDDALRLVVTQARRVSTPRGIAPPTGVLRGAWAGELGRR